MFHYHGLTEIFKFRRLIYILAFKIRNLGNNNRNLGNNNRNLENNSRINSDNNVNNESNNECNNTRELVNVTNSVNNENSNINLDSSNNFISIMTRGSNSNSDESSSNWRGVYYFLLGGKKKFNSIGDREWNVYVNAN